MANSDPTSYRAANELAAHYLNICHSNAQSLPLHISEIQKVAQDNNIQVFGITETYLTPSIPSIRVEIPHFNLFRVDRIGKAWGGVAIYVHESISAKEVSRSAQPTVYQKRPEFLFLELTVGLSKILCGTIYGPDKGGFWSDVEEALFDNSAYNFTVIMGDFNINWLSSSSPRNTLSDILSCCNLYRLPFTPTYHEKKINGHESHTAIDYICVSDISKVTSHHQEQIPHISNHDVLFTTLRYSVPNYSPEPISKRSYKNFKVNNVLRDLDAVDWNLFDSLGSVDSKVMFLSDAFITTYDTHAPFRTFTPKKRYTPWITSAIWSLDLQVLLSANLCLLIRTASTRTSSARVIM